MSRYKAIICYDGTEFYGYQRQKNRRTVQEELEKALYKLDWNGKSITAAGRTDTGVHAKAQVIAFDFDWKHEIHKLQQAINAFLPKDVSIRQITIAKDDFHPRYDAVAREYQYQIYLSETRDPLLDRYAWKKVGDVDVDKMNMVAKLFVGEHDFSLFGTPPKKNGSAIRKVFSAEWYYVEAILVFRILANAFLYHMVRRVVYVQTLIGLGKIDISGVVRALERKAELVPGIAEPQGLFLSNVFYDYSFLANQS